MKKLTLQIKRTEHAQSLIELSVTIIVLLLLLSGIVDLGRITFRYITLRDAAQEGATYGAIYPTYCDQIIQRVQGGNGIMDPSQVLVKVEINGKECHVATMADACAGNPIAITVHQPDFSLTMPMIGAAIGKQSIELKNTVTDTILRPECP